MLLIILEILAKSFRMAGEQKRLQKQSLHTALAAYESLQHSSSKKCFLTQFNYS